MRFELAPRLFRIRNANQPRSGSASRRSRHRPSIEGLEDRRLLAAPTPNIAMISASTPDSNSVVLDYAVQNADLPRSFELGVYRSADATFDPSDQLVGSFQVVAPGTSASPPTLDANGHDATQQGVHQLDIPLANGLPPNPLHPYVLVVANPSGSVAETTTTDNTASFRKHTIAIVTHGGLQSTPGNRIPAWENRMANALKAQGYDVVIPFNWVAVSDHPGSAAKQGPRLANQVRQAAEQFPANEPVDLHFIGHSEGTVVNGVALQQLQKQSTPQIDAGFIKETLLDPHAANNGFPAPQYSVRSGFMGWVARKAINDYQARAKDPFVVVPSNVDQAEVFYQKTPVQFTHGSNGGLFNLWGQVPVKGEATYCDITGPGISHSGDFNVHDWYQVNVIPTLGNGTPYVCQSLLTASLSPASGTPASTTGRLGVASVHRPEFQGTSGPNARIWIVAGSPKGAIKIGQTNAGPDGSWSLTTRNLRNGNYRVRALALVPADPAHPRVQVMPRLRLGELTVNAPAATRRPERGS